MPDRSDIAPGLSTCERHVAITFISSIQHELGPGAASDRAVALPPKLHQRAAGKLTRDRIGAQGDRMRARAGVPKPLA